MRTPASQNVKPLLPSRIARAVRFGSAAELLTLEFVRNATDYWNRHLPRSGVQAPGRPRTETPRGPRPQRRSPAQGGARAASARDATGRAAVTRRAAAGRGRALTMASPLARGASALTAARPTMSGGPQWRAQPGLRTYRQKEQPGLTRRLRETGTQAPGSEGRSGEPGGTRRSDAGAKPLEVALEVPIDGRGTRHQRSPAASGELRRAGAGAGSGAAGVHRVRVADGAPARLPAPPLCAACGPGAALPLAR